MKIVIEFDVENAAFDDDASGETARILHDVAERLNGGELDGRIRDINGNHIGHFGYVEGADPR